MPETRIAVIWSAVLWVTLVSVSYWIAGPHSYSAIQTELDFSVPIHQYYASLPAGTRFAHEFAGGVDAFAINQFTGQFVSLERILVTALPTWLGIATHKVMLASVGFAGAYILCRRLSKCDRQLSFAAGGAYSLASDALTIHSFWHGLAIGLLPLAVYLIVVRHDRRNYHLGVALFGALYAVTTTVPVAILSFVVTLPLAAILILGIRGSIRTLPGLCIVFVVVLLNWHESIFAMTQIAPFTLRQFAGIDSIQQAGLIGKFIDVQRNVYMDSNLVIAVATVSIIYLFLHKGQNVFRKLSIVAAFCLFGVYLYIISVFPWELVGLGLIKSLSFTYARHGLPTIMVLLVAVVSAHVVSQENTRIGQGIFAALILSLAIGKLAYYKAYEPITWLASGGLGVYDVESLKLPSWLPKEPFRVAAVPYRLPDNVLPTLGLHSATAIFSLQTASTVDFWNAVNTQPESIGSSRFTAGPSLYARLGEGVGSCCAEYDIEKFGVDPELLGVANVRYLISRNVLTGGGLKLVDGPSEGTILPRSTTPLREKIIRSLRWIYNPDELYVYELPRHTPRVFAARKIITVSDDLPARGLLKTVSEYVPKRFAVLRQTELKELDEYGSDLKILDYSIVKNGFDVTVEKGSKGVLIVNVPHLPFWKARSDGKELKVAPANGIHMAIGIPESTRIIEIRYERPLLREKFYNFVSGLWYGRVG